MNPTRLAAAAAAAALLTLGVAGPVHATPDDDPKTPPPTSEPPSTPPSSPSNSPTPTPTEPPKFSFGFDDVKLSTTRVVPGGKTTFTVTCPTQVTITSNAYTQNPIPVAKSGEDTWTGTGTFKSSLPNPSFARVTCAEHGTITFTTNPQQGEMKPGKPAGRIPSGRIDTGDGSTQSGTGLTLVAGSSAAALAAAGVGAFALRRRIGRERS